MSSLNNIFKSQVSNFATTELTKVVGNLPGMLGLTNGEKSRQPAPELQNYSTKYSTQNLSFPLDVEAGPTRGNHGHYVMFYINEWEEKFDREQKAREHKENLREQRLRQKELEKIKSFEDKENPVEGNFSSGLEKFKVDTTKEN